jgi:hypothetical protein
MRRIPIFPAMSQILIRFSENDITEWRRIQLKISPFGLSPAGESAGASVGLGNLPRRHRAGNYVKQGVRFWTRKGLPSGKPRRSPDPQFVFEVPPFVIELPACSRDWLDAARRGYLRYVESVTPPGGLGMHGLQISRNGFQGRRTVAEADELRMTGVTLCFAAKNRLCQQRFAPERDKPADVQVFRMECPKAHISVLPKPLVMRVVVLEIMPNRVDMRLNQSEV